MFENYFEKNKTPEQAEKQLRKIAKKELSNGVNGTSIYLAFKAVREKNQDSKQKLANNYLLNIVKDTAIATSGAIEDSLYGGPEQTFANINAEIQQLREKLTDKEKRT